MIVGIRHGASATIGLVIMVAAVALLAAREPFPQRVTHGSAGNYIRIHDIIYAAQLPTEIAGLGRVVRTTDLGAEFARIPDDEFPSLLRAGTPVFTVRDYQPHFRLAGSEAGELVLFEAVVNPAAQVGRDLLDVQGKVSSIGILDDRHDGPGYVQVAAMTDQAQVAPLVEMVLQAPVDQDVPSQGRRGGPEYRLAWHLGDGTVVVRPYWSGTNELFYGIMLPSEFGAVLKQAMATH